jgi:hypothetical protein
MPYLLERIQVAEPPSTEKLADFAGSYRSEELDTTWRIELRDARLWLAHKNAPPEPLLSLRADEFHQPGLRLVFTREAEKVTGIVLFTGRARGIRFAR